MSHARFMLVLGLLCGIAIGAGGLYGYLRWEAARYYAAVSAMLENLKDMPPLPPAALGGPAVSGRTCSIDGTHWFPARADGMCWSADAPSIGVQ